MRNLDNLANELEDEVDEIIGRVSHPAVKRAAKEIAKSVIFATPVDTSKAVSNWVVTLGTPATFLPRQPLVPGEKGSTFTQSASQAFNEAVRVIGQSRSGERIFINNTVDYIVELNEGKSPQAPPGFIEAAVQRGQRAARVGE